MKTKFFLAASILMSCFILNACGNKSGSSTGKDTNSSNSTSKGQSPQTFNGTGAKSEIVNLNEGLATFDIINNSGFSNFNVLLKDSNGKNVSMLANESGTFNGTVSVKIPETGKYRIDVKSEGKWSVVVK